MFLLKNFRNKTPKTSPQPLSQEFFASQTAIVAKTRSHRNLRDERFTSFFFIMPTYCYKCFLYFVIVAVNKKPRALFFVHTV